MVCGPRWSFNKTFMRKLDELHEPPQVGKPDQTVRLKTRQKMTTLGMLVVGLVDFLLNLVVAVALTRCPQLRWLLLAWVLPLAITAVSNLVLGWKAIRKLEKSHSGASDWRHEHVTFLTIIVFCSVSRIESMAALGAAGMPMPSEHFDFLRFAGDHHYLMADMPHVLVAIAMLWIGFDPNAENLDNLKNLLGFDSGSTGWFSEGSIVIGVLGIA